MSQQGNEQEEEKKEEASEGNTRREEPRMSKEEPRLSKSKTGLIDVFGNDEERVKCPLVAEFLESKWFQIFITVITIYALFGDDLKIMIFDKRADIYFDAFNIFCLIVFASEIVLNTLAKPQYLFSFFFWLDVISTVSIIFDIQIFLKAIGLSSGESVATNTAQLARAGRASRVGTKAGRVVRLVRLIRIVKIYKASNDEQEKKEKKEKLKKQKQNKSRRVQPSEEEDTHNQDLKESKVSKILSEITTKRTIIIVLILMFFMPLFQIDYYIEDPKSIQYAPYALIQFAQYAHSNQESIKLKFTQLLDKFHENDNQIVVFVTPFQFIPIHESSEYQYLRTDEMSVGVGELDKDLFLKHHVDLSSTLKDDLKVVAITNLREYSKHSALISFFRTIFVCIVLTFGALMFSKDANDLALHPLERVIEKINKIAQNPNQALELKIQQDDKIGNEIIKLENTIIKIGSLLAVGFGQAGSEILGQNLAQAGELNAMLSGTKIFAIYAFCDIRNFTDATEVLQEDIMVFVNTIGEIVHEMVCRYGGAPNKNIGDAFLLVWKAREEMYSVDEERKITWSNRKYIQILSDCALISIIKILVKLHREPEIINYRNNQALQDRIPNYRVKLGFGLHFGGAIEGAIGSEYKIDPSYISSCVNLASQLEENTKQYGVHLLLSSNFHQYLSVYLTKFTRKIDNVHFLKANVKLGLYTVDITTENLPISKDPKVHYKDFTKQDLKYIQDEKRKYKLGLIEKEEFNTQEELTNNKDLALALKNHDHHFLNAFNKSFRFYQEGQWETSKIQFEYLLQNKGDDGPTKALLAFMHDHDYQSPEHWDGYKSI